MGCILLVFGTIYLASLSFLIGFYRPRKYKDANNIADYVPTALKQKHCVWNILQTITCKVYVVVLDLYLVYLI